MKVIGILVVFAALGAGGFFGWQNWQKRQVDTDPNKRPTTAVVEARDIHFEVSAAGDIGPADQVSVRSEINGRIAELPVDLGDKVKKDDLLCRLDDKDLQTDRASRLIEIESANLQFEKSARNLARVQKLFADHLISREVYDDSKTENEMATNAVNRAMKGLRQVEDQLSKTKILAPFDCTVLTRPVSVGQAVSGSAGFNSGTEIMTIANLNDMIISAHINQADVTRLTPNQDVSIQVESVPGLTMKGVLDRIAPQAVIKNGIKGFGARITIKHMDPRVRPGMTAIVGLPVASAENVLSVPLPAIFSEQGERFVYVKKETGFERRPVLVGISDLEFAEIQSGLADGEVVSLEEPAEARVAKARTKEKKKSSPAINGKTTTLTSTNTPPGSGRPVADGSSGGTTGKAQTARSPL